MSCPKLRPSARGLRALEALRPGHHLRPPLHCLRRLAHDDPSSRESREPRKPFRGQLLESIGQRLERERAEQARFAEARGDGSGGRYAATTFVFVAIALSSFYFGTLVPVEPSHASTLPLSETKAPYHKTYAGNLQAAWVDFAAVVGEEHVSTNAADLAQHAGSDYSSYRHQEGEQPFLILYPASTHEVSAIMKICHERRIPVTPYSGGTSLEGHFSATKGGVCIDFQRMDQILTLHKADLDVVVQPSVGWEALNDELAEQGLFFPPDPGPGAMIGGMVGTGCSGTNAYRYGTMKDWVLSLTVVLADGSVVRTRQRPRKSSAGYDLTRLFVGSEGTLGLVTEATLRVTVKPPSESVAVASFPSVRAAAACVARVVAQGVPVAAVEILDDVQMRCINEAGVTSRAWKEAPTLFFKFAGTPAGVKEQIGLVQTMAKREGSHGFEFARNAEEARELWSARKEALWSVMAKKRDPGDKVWTTDVAVPISRLADIIEETKEDVRRSGLMGSMVGHVGDGNFHTILLYNEKERHVADDLVHRMVKRAVEMEGTVTGEHGVGVIKRDYLNHELGESTVDLMRKLKLALDPLCLLNCDKVVRASQPKAGEVQPW